MFDGVAKLADVAKPVPLPQFGQGLGRDRRPRARIAIGKHVEKMLGQRADVFAALAERRQFDFEGDQAEVEIVAKLALGHPLLQVLVRRGDHAKIAAQGVFAAHRHDLAELQHAEQLDLEGHGDVGHFIEEDRAAAGLFEEAFSRLLRPGEGPADVAEELAFGQRGAERRHVYGDERPGGPAAIAMNGPGDHFLAGAAFAADVYAGVGRGDQGNPFEDFLHGRTGADDQPRRVFRRQADGGIHGPGIMFQRAFDHPLGHGQVEWFGQIVEGPVPHGGDGGGEFAVGGHHDDRHARRGLLEVLHRCEAVHARQADIEHDHVRPHRVPCPGRGETLFGRDGGRGRMAQLFGQFAQTPADALFVINDEEVGHD